MPIRFEAQGPVVLVTIDRPEAMNALDPETSDALVEAWRRFRDDDGLRVAVLTGAGPKAFSAGVDTKRVKEWYARFPKGRRREAMDEAPGLGGLTRNLDPGKPVLAAVNGHCLGGGLELALACDLRIASTTASFGLPELKLGILPGQGGTQRLPRSVPAAVAMHMVLTGEPIGAQAALAWGLVSEVVPPERLLPRALELAGLIASRPEAAVRRAREAIRRGLDLPLEEALRFEQLLADPLRDGVQGPPARPAGR